MSRGISILEAILIALWLGGGVFLALVAAPAAFANAPSRAAAGDIVGAMLTRWHYVALIVPLLLLILERRRFGLARTTQVVLLSTALFFAAAQAGADLRIRQMRNTLQVSSLPPGDPDRKMFGLLHGASMLFMLIQILSAAGLTAARAAGDQGRSRSAASETE